VAATARRSSLAFVGRLSRAAVFSGLAACWTNTTREPTAATPPPPPNDDTSMLRAQDRAAGPASLTGQVINKTTNAPVPNAVVELHDQNGRVAATNTDADGRYRFDGLRPDDYQVVVRYSTPIEAGSAQLPVSFDEKGGALVVLLPVYNRASVPKPYGAPPARRRIV
jgi:hypothetical protein